MLSRLFFGVIAFALAAVPVKDATPQFAETATDPSLAPLVALAAGIGPHYRIDTSDHFAIVHAAEPLWAQEMRTALERSHMEFYRRLEGAGFHVNRPTERLVWLCFTEHSQFESYGMAVDQMDLSWLDGYYSARTNRVALVRLPPAHLHKAVTPISTVRGLANPPRTDAVSLSSYPDIDLPRASHEAAHQLSFNSGLLKRGVMYPLWVAEGLATNFEVETLEAFGSDAPDPQRVGHLTRAVAAHRAPPFAEFLAVTRVPADDALAANDLYDYSWGVFRFLLAEHRDRLAAYLEALTHISPGPRSERALRRELESAFGSLEALGGEWEAYVERLGDGTLNEPATSAPRAVP